MLNIDFGFDVKVFPCENDCICDKLFVIVILDGGVEIEDFDKED
jgi:hypothetical protein